MIKAREINTGIYVYEEGETTPIVLTGSEVFSDLCDPILYDPIPLTEEWLVRLGFTDGGNREGPGKRKGGFQILHTYGSSPIKFWYETVNDSVKIHHVHQLQNLYYTMTGEELIRKDI